MKIKESNYFSPAVQMEYMGSSQLKAAMECEARALAEIKGEWVRPSTMAQLVGSYVDAYFTGDLDHFRFAHEEELYTRKGELRSDFKRCETITSRIEREPLFMDFLSGEHQVIMTGEIEGEPFKIKIDSYFPGSRIVDLKVMKDMKPVWKGGQMQDFVRAWGYHIQGYIYQWIVAQNIGKALPFWLAVATKEDEPDLRLFEIPDKILHSAEGLVSHYVKRWAAVKRGEAEPKRCEECAYCRSTRRLSPENYLEYILDKEDL